MQKRIFMKYRGWPVLYHKDTKEFEFDPCGFRQDAGFESWLEKLKEPSYENTILLYLTYDGYDILRTMEYHDIPLNLKGFVDCVRSKKLFYLTNSTERELEQPLCEIEHIFYEIHYLCLQ